MKSKKERFFQNFQVSENTYWNKNLFWDIVVFFIFVKVKIVLKKQRGSIFGENPSHLLSPLACLLIFISADFFDKNLKFSTVRKLCYYDVKQSGVSLFPIVIFIYLSEQTFCFEHCKIRGKKTSAPKLKIITHGLSALTSEQINFIAFSRRRHCRKINLFFFSRSPTKQKTFHENQLYLLYNQFLNVKQL